MSECCYSCHCVSFFFFKQKTAYEMRISDWSSDVCSSDLRPELDRSNHHPRERPRATARHCRKVYCHRKRVGRTQLSALLDRYGLVLSLLQRKRKSRLY